MRCDITDPDAVEAAFAEVEAAHGPVEVLVANAGITADTLLLRMSEDDWSSVIDTNLTGSFRLAKRAAPRGCCGCAAAGSSSSPRSSACSARRARSTTPRPRPGLVGMARSIARELRLPRRSPPTSSRPGFVETDMTAVLTDEQKAAIKAQVPLGRYAAAGRDRRGGHLAGRRDGAAYVTGAVIPVDGGLGMGH